MAFTQDNLFDAKLGSRLIVRDEMGTIVRVVQVIGLSSTRIRAGGMSFLRSTGKEYGGTRRAILGSFDAIVRAEAELEGREEERRRQEKAKEQAEYDALPEAVKLTRRIVGVCNWQSAQKIADMIPLEILRQFAAAIKE